MFYTNKEKTERKYTPIQASNAALAIIKDKSKGQLNKVCVDALKGVNDTILLTLVEMNAYTDEMVNDTFYYDGYKVK